MSVVPVIGTGTAVLFGIILLTALPLYITVKLMGGRVGLLTVVGANVLVGLVTVGLQLFGFPGWLGFVAGLLIYRHMFDLGLARVVIALLLQGVVAAVLVFLAITLLGLSLGGLMAFAV
jgi:hypothetical protein